MYDKLDAEGAVGQIAVRPFAHELTGALQERSLIERQPQNNNEALQEQSQLRLFFEEPENNISYDHRREELTKMLRNDI
jgi:hypothetical protein